MRWVREVTGHPLTDREPGTLIAGHQVRVQLGHVDLSAVLVVAHHIAHGSAPFPPGSQPHER
jgi:hypothetical protein